MTQAVDEAVHAISPDGRKVEIRPDKLTEAADAGYQLLTPEQFAAGELEAKEGLGGTAKAFAESAASGASLGLSDVAGGALLGDDWRTNRRLREIANPTASTVGETAGMLAPLLIPGGAAAEGATALAEGGSLIGRAAGAAARYSPVGLTMRAGEAASELVGTGLGAIGIGGEGAGLLGRVASRGLQAAAGGAVEGAAFGAGGALSEAALAPGGDYDGIAQKLWAGAIDGAEFGAVLGGGIGAGGELLASGARKLGGTFSAREAIQDLADAKTLKSAGLESADVARMARENPERLSELADVLRNEKDVGWLDSASSRAEKLSAARADADDVLSKMRKGLDEARGPGEGVNVRAALDQAEARIEQLKATAGTVAEDRVVSKAVREIKRMGRDFAEGEPATFEAAHTLSRKLDDIIADHPPGPGGKPNPFVQQLKALRGDLETEFETATGKVMGKTSPEFNAQYADAKARYGALDEVVSAATKRESAGSLGGGMSGSVADTLTGLHGFATLGPKGMLLAAANRALRSTQADHIVGKLADSIAKFDSHVDAAAGRWAQRARTSATKTTRVAATETAKTISNAAEQKRRLAEYAKKLNGAREESTAEPGALVSIPGAPKTQEAAERVRRAAAAWLVKQAPVAPADIEHPLLQRIARQLKPNPTEVAAFLRKVATVEDPRIAVKALEDGRLTTDHVDALEATAPAILEQLRQSVIERITDKNADIGWDARKQLGILLGVETDPSLRPEAIALSQQVYSEARNNAEQQQQQQQPPGPSAPGRTPKGMTSRVDVLEEGSAY